MKLQVFLKGCISEDASYTLNQLKKLVMEKFMLTVSTSTIDRVITGLYFSFKRVQLIPLARNTSTNFDVRKNYSNFVIPLDEDKLIYIDETGINCSMRLSRGRSEIGVSPRKIVRTQIAELFDMCCDFKDKDFVL
jgi:hypothetical protein